MYGDKPLKAMNEALAIAKMELARAIERRDAAKAALASAEATVTASERSVEDFQKVADHVFALYAPEPVPDDETPDETQPETPDESHDDVTP